MWGRSHLIRIKPSVMRQLKWEQPNRELAEEE